MAAATGPDAIAIGLEAAATRPEPTFAALRRLEAAGGRHRKPMRHRNHPARRNTPGYAGRTVETRQSCRSLLRSASFVCASVSSNASNVSALGQYSL